MASVSGTTSAPTSAPVRFMDLGKILVEVDQTIRPAGGKRPSAALALLLINANRRVIVDAARPTRTTCAGVPWPGIPATAVLLERAHAGTPARVGQRAWEDGALLTLHDVAAAV